MRKILPAVLLLLFLCPVLANAQDNSTGTTGGSQANGTQNEHGIELPLPEIDFGHVPYNYRDQLETICQRAIAAVTCKDPYDFHVVKRMGDSFMFDGVYGSGYAEFYCQRMKNSLRISCSKWGKIRQTVHFQVEDKRECVRVTVGKSLCDKWMRFRVCRDAANEGFPEIMSAK